MKIECNCDPNDLINQIGDRYFSIDEEFSGHPKIIRIMDCEGEAYIDVCSDLGIAETEFMANALLRLLNQEYELISE